MATSTFIKIPKTPTLVPTLLMTFFSLWILLKFLKFFETFDIKKNKFLMKQIFCQTLIFISTLVKTPISSVIALFIWIFLLGFIQQEFFNKMTRTIYSVKSTDPNLNIPRNTVKRCGPSAPSHRTISKHAISRIAAAPNGKYFARWIPGGRLHGGIISRWREIKVTSRLNAQYSSS